MVNILITSQNLLRKRHQELVEHTIKCMSLRDNDDDFEDFVETSPVIDYNLLLLDELEKCFEDFDKTVFPTLTKEQALNVLQYKPYKTVI